MRLKLLYCFAALLRALLVLYAELHDRTSPVKYTDIDYFVFSDAAEYVAQGRSPYERHTYRYTPFLALLLVPNALARAVWGKALFCLADLLVARWACRVLSCVSDTPRNAHGTVNMAFVCC